MEAVDVQSASLYSDVDKEIYMEFLEGFKIHGLEDKVLYFKKVLYGLKQAGLAWWNTLNKSMKELRFEHLM